MRASIGDKNGDQNKKERVSIHVFEMRSCPPKTGLHVDTCDGEKCVCMVQREGKGAGGTVQRDKEGGILTNIYMVAFDLALFLKKNLAPLAVARRLRLTRIRKHQIKMMSAEVKNQRNLRSVRADILDHRPARPTPHRGVHTLPGPWVEGSIAPYDIPVVRDIAAAVVRAEPATPRIAYHGRTA